MQTCVTALPAQMAPTINLSPATSLYGDNPAFAEGISSTKVELVTPE